MEDVSRRLKLTFLITTIFFIALVVISIPAYAWFANRELTVYAPVDVETSLYIGAGNQEDIRYLSFEGIDATSNKRYIDYVFCISGEFVRYYKIQLAYTTNNQFTFGLFRATTKLNEKNPNYDDVVNYIPRTGNNHNPITYYISNLGEVVGDFKNQNGEAILGIKDTTDDYYSDTYGDYTNVDRNAVPLYWQTRNTINVGQTASFVHYYILRLYLGEKDENDRESDILCIAAKVCSSSSD